MTETKFEKIDLLTAVMEKVDVLKFFKTEYGYTFHHVRGFRRLKQSNENPKLIVDVEENMILLFKDENHLEKDFVRTDLLTYLINYEEMDRYRICEMIGIFLGMDVYVNGESKDIEDEVDKIKDTVKKAVCEDCDTENADVRVYDKTSEGKIIAFLDPVTELWYFVPIKTDTSGKVNCGIIGFDRKKHYLGNEIMQYQEIDTEKIIAFMDNARDFVKNYGKEYFLQIQNEWCVSNKINFS